MSTINDPFSEYHPYSYLLECLDQAKFSLGVEDLGFPRGLTKPMRRQIKSLQKEIAEIMTAIQSASKKEKENGNTST